MSEVVCVKVNCIRPKYKNLKEWCNDPNNVYIARKGVVFIDGIRYPEKDSIFANPFKLGKNATEQDREQCILQYEQYLLQMISEGKIIESDMKSLLGKKLGCWCKDKDQKCHGDILIKYLHYYFPE